MSSRIPRESNESRPSSESALLRATANALRPVRTELGSLWRLAWPVVLTNVGFLLMGVVDTIMLGQVSQEAIGSAAIGLIFLFGCFVLPMGILAGLDPIVSQAVGAKDYAGVGRAVVRGLILAGLLSIPLMIIYAFAGPALRLLGQPEELIGMSTGYVYAYLPATPAALMFIALRNVMQGLGYVRPLIIVPLAANVVNFFANWVLIFGVESVGIPAYGVVGAGIATAISRYFMFGLLVAIILWLGIHKQIFPADRQPFRWFDWGRIGRMLRLGIPIGFHIAFEVWAFNAAGLMMGWLGKMELAAHAIAINMAALLFMIPMGIGSAASVRVGQAIGRGDLPAARRSAAVAIGFTLSIMLVTATVLLSAPEALAGLYTNEAALIAMVAALLPLAAAFQLFDGAQAVGFGILRGAGDTNVALWFNALGFYVLGLPIGYWLAFHNGQGPQGVWLALVIGLSVVAVLLIIRVRYYLGRDVRPLQGVT